MADICILPARVGDGRTNHASELLSAAFVGGVDLGSRGHHIRALAVTLEQNLAKLQEIANELDKSPVRDTLQLDTMQEQIKALGACVVKLIAMTKPYSG